MYPIAFFLESAVCVCVDLRTPRSTPCSRDHVWHLSTILINPPKEVTTAIQFEFLFDTIRKVSEIVTERRLSNEGEKNIEADRTVHTFFDIISLWKRMDSRIIL